MPPNIRSKEKLIYECYRGNAGPVAYPDADFAVISDLHMYNPSLGSTGEAFEKVLKMDRKLLLDSMALVDLALDDIARSQARFVLICGDLTKDGELVNHTTLSQMLRKLTDAGKKVYVVPGNHDIHNPFAETYSEDVVEQVDSIGPEDFARIYADYGFSGALERDEHSLSYLSEPVEGLWLLTIDSCRYRENLEIGRPIPHGRIYQPTLSWVARVLAKALELGKAVMVHTHHGVVEHWLGQYIWQPFYLVEDFPKVGQFLASYHVRLVFSGHYHAQDITWAGYRDGTWLYDVETGALVTSPSPLRYCSLRDNQLTVKSHYLLERLRPGTDYAEKATAFVKYTIVISMSRLLKSYHVSDEDTAIIADAVSDAFAAHYRGDENPAERVALDKRKLSTWGRFVLYVHQFLLDGLWTDLYPGDNNVTLSLEKDARALTRP